MTHRYGGFPFTVLLADPLAEGWYDHDWPELPELTLLRRHKLVGGARVFDLGAHQCVVALMLARIVGADGSVIAVEAEPRNAGIGDVNCLLNDARNLTVVNAAVSDRGGTLRFVESLNGRVAKRGGWGTTKIAAVTVDGLAAAYGLPDVLLIDVEGFECRALAGARRTLEAHRPDVFVEVHAGCGLEQAGGSIEQVLQAFPGEAYDLFVATAFERGDEHVFAPFDRNNPPPGRRFFLIATAGVLGDDLAVARRRELPHHHAIRIDDGEAFRAPEGKKLR